MTPGAYLRNMRERRGHSTVSTLASYMQSLNHRISREALRQYESNKAVPGELVRAMLYQSLIFTAEDVADFERICAEQVMREKFSVKEAYIVDTDEASRRGRHIAAQVKVGLYGRPDLTEDQVQFILTTVEQSCQKILAPSPLEVSL